MSFEPTIEDTASDQDLLFHLNRRQRITCEVNPIADGPFRDTSVSGDGSQVEPFLCVVGLGRPLYHDYVQSNDESVIYQSMSSEVTVGEAIWSSKPLVRIADAV
jgi:hypothetical protein